MIKWLKSNDNAFTKVDFEKISSFAPFLEKERFSITFFYSNSECTTATYNTEKERDEVLESLEKLLIKEGLLLQI